MTRFLGTSQKRTFLLACEALRPFSRIPSEEARTFSYVDSPSSCCAATTFLLTIASWRVQVMCDCYTPQGEPIPTNKRYAASKIFEQVKDEETWYVFEWVVTLRLDLCIRWPSLSLPFFVQVWNWAGVYIACGTLISKLSDMSCNPCLTVLKLMFFEHRWTSGLMAGPQMDTLDHR